MDLPFMFSKSLVHTPTCKAVNNHPKLKKGLIFLGKYRIFPERLKDSTECKYNCVTSVDVTRYQTSKSITRNDRLVENAFSQHHFLFKRFEIL